jgi:hypothetical protein
VAGAVDDGVSNMADGGAGWCSSDHGNQGKMSQEVARHGEAPRRRRRGANGLLRTTNRWRPRWVALLMAAGENGMADDSVGILGRGFAGEPQEGGAHPICCLVEAGEQWRRRTPASSKSGSNGTG